MSRVTSSCIDHHRSRPHTRSTLFTKQNVQVSRPPPGDAATACKGRAKDKRPLFVVILSAVFAFAVREMSERFFGEYVGRFWIK